MINSIQTFFTRRALEALAREIKYHQGAIAFHNAAIAHKTKLAEKKSRRLQALGSMV